MIPLRKSHVVFYAAIVTLTVTVALGFGFWFIRQQMLTGNDFLLDAESKEILSRLNNVPLPLNPQKIQLALQEHTKYDEALFYFQVHLPTGLVVFRSPNLGHNTLLDLTGGNHKRTVDMRPYGLMRVAEYYTPAAHIQIAMSLRNFERINESFIWVFLLGVPFIAALSLGFGMVLRHLTLRPVLLMQSAAQRISAHNLSERILIPPGGAEMAALAQFLNDMIDRLEKSFNHSKRFTADISHELMTPLSIIRLHAERLLNDPELPAKYHASVEEQLQETLHLTETLERLLILARADSSALSLKLQSDSTAAFMSQSIEDAQILAEARGLKVILAESQDAVAVFDHGWIRQVLFNLLSNALRYTPKGGNITFVSKCNDRQWTVEVWDEGCGVPENRLADIFNRFVQINSRPELGSGAGLGLAICKSIVELHKGTIQACNRTDRTGLVVAFSLPLRPFAE